MQRTEIIKAVDAYAEASGLKQTTICQYAVQNRHFYDNLVGGKDYQVGTADRLIEWMRANPAEARGAA